MMHWAFEYLGRPWIAKVHECGHFFVDVQRERFGVVSQVIDADSLSVLSCVRALSGHHPELLNWVEVEVPEEGDAVQMSHSRHPHHIGVWVDVDGGGVLHCVEGPGVVFSTRKSLKAHGWNIVSIKRHRSRTHG